MSNMRNLLCSEVRVLNSKRDAIFQENDSAVKKLHKVPLWLPKKHMLLASCQNGHDNCPLLQKMSPVVCIVCV